MTEQPFTAADVEALLTELDADKLSEADADALDEARGRLGAERLLKAIDAHAAAWEAAGWVRRAWWRATRGGPEV